jgi:hypothetical protein
MLPEKAKAMCEEIELITAERNISKLLAAILDDLCAILLSRDNSEQIGILLNEVADIKKSLSPTARHTLVLTRGVEFHGTGVQLQTDIPIQEVSMADCKEVLYDKPKNSIVSLAKRIIKSGKKDEQNIDENKES